MIRENTSDFIAQHLPKHFAYAHGTSHHAVAPGPPPSRSGAGGCNCAFCQKLQDIVLFQ